MNECVPWASYLNNAFNTIQIVGLAYVAYVLRHRLLRGRGEGDREPAGR